MSYTNPWSDAIPLGSSLASTIDDSIRQLRLDIHDRMNSIVTDWTADPIVLQPQSGGPINGKNIFIHHSAFTPASPSITYTVGVTPFTKAVPIRTALNTQSIGTVDLNAPTVTMWAPVILPQGVSITGVVFNIQQLAGSATFKLRKFVFNTAPTLPTITDLTIGTTDTAAYKSYIINPSPAYVVLNNDVLFLEVTFDTNTQLYSAAITYNIANVSQTI